MTTEKAIAKVKQYVADHYGGSWRKAFLDYDVDGDGLVGEREVGYLLADAGVGTTMTRVVFARMAVDKLDQDGSGKVDFEEFEAALNNSQD